MEIQAIINFLHLIGTRFTLWLVGRHGAAYVLAGTLTLAAVGAAVANQPPTTVHSQPVTAQTTNASAMPMQGGCPNMGDGSSAGY
jgi:hypothetical protein